MKPITITLTSGEAQAIADLMDREVRTNGGQAAAVFGPVLRQIIEAVQAEAAQKQETDDNG